MFFLPTGITTTSDHQNSRDQPTIIQGFHILSRSARLCRLLLKGRKNRPSVAASIVRSEKMLEKYIVMAEALEELEEAA